MRVQFETKSALHVSPLQWARIVQEASRLVQTHMAMDPSRVGALDHLIAKNDRYTCARVAVQRVLGISGRVLSVELPEEIVDLFRRLMDGDLSVEGTLLGAYERDGVE